MNINIKHIVFVNLVKKEIVYDKTYDKSNERALKEDANVLINGFSMHSLKGRKRVVNNTHRGKWSATGDDKGFCYMSTPEFSIFIFLSVHDKILS